MGKIIAIGGGENGRPGTKYETKQIDQEIVKISGKKHPKLLFMAPPSRFQEDYFQIMKKVFVKFGCKISPLYLSNPNPSKRKIEKTILGSDVIYVGGGNTLKMMTIWRRLGVDKLLRKAYKKGIVLSGLSAGAICWFKYGNSDSRKFTSGSKKLIKVTGLGLVDTLYCPHYDIEQQRKSDLKRMMRTTPGIAIAVDNCCAIETIDDQYRIIASKRNANAYKVYWKKGKYHKEIIEKKKEFTPLKELLKK